jgi:hypothetical protein
MQGLKIQLLKISITKVLPTLRIMATILKRAAPARSLPLPCLLLTSQTNRLRHGKNYRRTSDKNINGISFQRKPGAPAAEKWFSDEISFNPGLVVWDVHNRVETPTL